MKSCLRNNIDNQKKKRNFYLNNCGCSGISKRVEGSKTLLKLEERC